MRLGHYPQAVEILGGLSLARRKELEGEAPQAIMEAVLETERLLGEPLLEAGREKEYVLGTGAYFLEDHPVRNLVVEGLPKDYYECNQKRGILTIRGFGVPYRVTYQVGYLDGDLPAAIQLLLERLTKKKLGIEDLSVEEQEVLVSVAKRVRKVREQERYAIETSGKIVGEEHSQLPAR